MTVNVSMNLYVIREARPLIDQSSSSSQVTKAFSFSVRFGIFFEQRYLFLINVVMHVEFCLDICCSEVCGDLVMGLFSNKHVLVLLRFTTHTHHNSDSIPVHLSYFLPPQHFPEDPSDFLVPQTINEGIH